MSADELREAIRFTLRTNDCVRSIPSGTRFTTPGDDEADLMVDAILASPALRETLRLARIGAAFEAELLDMTHTPRFLLSFIVSVRDRAAVAAGVPVEPPEPT